VAGERTWAALALCDAGSWHSRSHAGEPIASLAAIAAYVQRNAYALNIEIKPTPGQELETGQVVGDGVLQLWRESAALPLFSSFRPEALQGARLTAPQVPRALLVDTLWPGWIETARELGCVAVVSNHRLMDAALMQQLQGAGLRGLCYTVNDAAEARRLLALGVVGIITDAVDQLSPADPGAQD
jgi:glycerophosphoryl diester phosphodiesterase